ncbi:hypothetical protein Tco_1098040, partial [Tanacetum coccineum]
MVSLSPHCFRLVNFPFGESSSTANLLTGNSKVVPTGPMGPNLGTIWRRMRDMEKLMMERIDTEGRIKRKFKEQDRHFMGLGCDNIEIDRTVRKTMSNLSGVKKLVKDLMKEQEGLYREFVNLYVRMLVFPKKKCQQSEDGFPVPSGSQVRKPPVEPFARSAPVPRFDDPYVVARDAAAAVTTSDSDDDDDTAPMDSQPYEPRGSPHMSWYENSRDPSLCCDRTMPPKRSSRGDPPPQLTQDTVNRMIQESVEAAIRAERERVRNEANRAGGPNVAP